MSDAALRSNLAQFARQAAGASPARIGLVTSYDPATHSVKVEVQPEGVESGWMPIQTMQIGAGWGVYAAPSQGDQAVVMFIEGDAEACVCIGFLPSDVDRPPNVPAGEIHLVHKAGAYLKLLSDGSIASNGTWAHTGDMTVTGDVHVTKTLTADTDVKTGTISLKTHKHGGVQSGASQTTTPV